MRKAGALLLVFAVVVVIAVLELPDPSDSDEVSPAVSVGSDSIGSTLVSPVAEAPSGDTQTASASSAETTAEAALKQPHPVFDELPVFDETSLGALIEQVRRGDTDAARAASDRLQACQQLLHNSLLLELLEKGSLDDSRDKAFRRHEAAWARGAYGDDEEYWLRRGVRLQERYDQVERDVVDCLPFWRNAVRELRLELEMMAAAGNRAARTLYALWPPKREFVWADRDEIARWEAKALEFSMENLVAGEPTALYVFARAYRHAGYFLPNNPRVASMFDMAIVRCGLDLSGDQVRQIKRWPSREDIQPIALTPALLKPLIKWSEELRPFCRSGIWLTGAEVTSLITSGDSL